jgi:hypothetical protein
MKRTCGKRQAMMTACLFQKRELEAPLWKSTKVKDNVSELCLFNVGVQTRPLSYALPGLITQSKHYKNCLARRLAESYFGMSYKAGINISRQ